MTETYNLTRRLHNVDLVEGQGTWGTHILPLPQLLGSLE